MSLSSLHSSQTRVRGTQVASNACEVGSRTREDEHVLHVLVLHVGKQPRVLTHSISGALEPLRTARARRLRSSQHLCSTAAVQLLCLLRLRRLLRARRKRCCSHQLRQLAAHADRHKPRQCRCCRDRVISRQSGPPDAARQEAAAFLASLYSIQCSPPQSRRRRSGCRYQSCKCASCGDSARWS